MDNNEIKNILTDLLKLVDILQKQINMHNQVLKQLTGYKEEE
tara:strand:- start:393 stop:518 length:126 start_codon:yes stop_codon:yes gene_type:complete